MTSIVILIHCDIPTLYNLISNSNKFRASFLLSFTMPSLYEVPQQAHRMWASYLSLVVFNLPNCAKKSMFSLTNVYLMFNDLQFCRPMAYESEGLRMWGLCHPHAGRAKVLEGVRNRWVALPLTTIKVCSNRRARELSSMYSGCQLLCRKNKSHREKLREQIKTFLLESLKEKSLVCL